MMALIVRACNLMTAFKYNIMVTMVHVKPFSELPEMMIILRCCKGIHKMAVSTHVRTSFGKILWAY